MHNLYIPPANRNIDLYAEKACTELHKKYNDFIYDDETVRGLATFLKIVGKIEANYQNERHQEND